MQASERSPIVTSSYSSLSLSSSSSEADEIVTKHGLEVGLFKALKSKNAGTAKEMLKKYGKQ